MLGKPPKKSGATRQRIMPWRWCWLERAKGEFRTANARHLPRSVGKEAAPAKAAKPAKTPRKLTAGQKQMLMPIEGKKPKETETKKSATRPQRKSA